MAAGERELFIWRGQDPDSDLKALTAALAPRVLRELFADEGRLARLVDGQFAPVSLEHMRMIVAEHVETFTWVDRGTAEGRHWTVEYHPFAFPAAGSLDDSGRVPTDKTLAALMSALVPLVAKAPSKQRMLNPQQVAEIRARLGVGEPRELIARYYGIEVSAVQAIRQAAAG